MDKSVYPCWQLKWDPGGSLRRGLSWPAAKIFLPLLVLGLSFFWSEPSYSKDVDLIALGIRGGINIEYIAIPPTEKEDFERYDVFAIIGLPWRWTYPSGWEVSWRLNGAAGVIRGGGDRGFISEITPGLAFSKPSWRVTLDFGGGGALLSKYKFGSQSFGGPFQFIGYAGLSVHLDRNFVAGWRFHHMSDATIYGKGQGVDFNMLELSYYF